MYPQTYPVFDDKDAAILAKRASVRDGLTGPLVGDFVRFPGEAWAWKEALEKSGVRL